MDKRSFLILAITKFEEKAYELITLMCDHFNLDIESPHPFATLQSRRTDLWKGKFQNWEYRFHGDSCEFINTKTRQFLDIKTNRKGNYGVIDRFFLFQFIDSTENLKELDPFVNLSEKQELYDQLKLEGLVINIGDDHFPIWVLNKDTL